VDDGNDDDNDGDVATSPTMTTTPTPTVVGKGAGVLSCVGLEFLRVLVGNAGNLLPVFLTCGL
jgi:hypothetical protein